MESRWALPDWQTTLKWFKDRNSQGIRCTIDLLGEYIKTEEEIDQAAERYRSILEEIRKENLNASLAIKPTALGANVNPSLCERALHDIAKEAQDNKVLIEIDMEGTPLVEFTITTAVKLARKGYPLILALQAYLKRTPDDIKQVLDQGITVRLVKGAYKGDYEDFEDIQKQFRLSFEQLLKSTSHYLVGTHDPQLISSMENKAQKDKMEFSFLLGLSDNTKLRLAKQGYKVSEYVPFGIQRTAYEIRRTRYLKTLEKLGRIPAP